MRITADTNVLVRAAVGDDAAEAAAARRALGTAEIVAVPLPALCEFVWVLARGYRRGTAEIARAVRQLLDSRGVAADRAAAEAGLAVLAAGGDFADGVIAFEGLRLGGAVLVSFDTQAVALARAAGLRAERPA